MKTTIAGCSWLAALVMLMFASSGCSSGGLSPASVPEIMPPAGPTAEVTPPPLTALEDLGVTGTPVEVDIQSWRLVVDGLVEHPLSLSYEQLLALPTVTQVPRLDCPGFFVDYAEWTGPLVRTVLEHAGLKPEAQQVWFFDGSQFPYERALPLDEALQDDAFLAHTLYGQPLPLQHGYPVRLVVSSRLGSYWVKWLVHIEVR